MVRLDLQTFVIRCETTLASILHPSTEHCTHPATLLTRDGRTRLPSPFLRGVQEWGWHWDQQCWKQAQRLPKLPLNLTSCSPWSCQGTANLPQPSHGSLWHPILLDTSSGTSWELPGSTSPALVWKHVWALLHCCIACHFLLGLLNTIMF